MSSRPSIAPSAARTLSLTEELEKLEQSVTLTLQEIDSNFSRAHRVVTGSILPIVQQYAQHSDQVWQSSRFWKDFFEASANISLTGYEESAADTTLRDDDDSFAHDDLTGTTDSSSALERPSSRLDADDDDAGDTLDDSLLLDSPAAASTPTGTPRPADPFAADSSPSDTLPQARRPGPATPAGARSPPAPHPDPLLHRVLDKNYRVQATPRTARRRSPARPPPRGLPAGLDSSPFRPAVQAPALRAEIFGPPPSARKARAHAAAATPRTPGVSVQRLAPAPTSGFTPGAQGTLFAAAGAAANTGRRRWSDDSDDEITDDTAAFFGGMSPPKTVALNFPSSRVVQTPAREASRRMVEDLVRTAGGAHGGDDDDDEITDEALYERPGARAGLADDEDSPSVVRVSGPDGGVDDSF